MPNNCDTLIIGAGAAGLMAAIQCAQRGQSVTLLEKMDRPGRKLLITGKGRCNVTNCCTIEEFMPNVLSNPRFLYSCLNALNPYEVMGFFEECGVPLKVERGERVFPVSDRSADIVQALVDKARQLGCRLVHGCADALLIGEERVEGVSLTDGQKLYAHSVIVATGGKSYPATGSTGDGYRLASELGHTVTDLQGSLVPLEAKGEDCPRMQGLALKNVRIKVVNQKKKVAYEGFGELLFTHFGLSGPLILSASAHLTKLDKNQYTVIIDLKPALEEKKLDERLVREFQAQANKDFQNALGSLLPRLMIPVIIERTGIPPETKVHDLTRSQRRQLLEQLKGFRVDITGLRPVEEAIVTSGGIKTSEVNPTTMESKKVSGLYLVGELLDVDGYTGGFNLQIAWATGYAAGRYGAKKETEMQK